MNALTAPGIIQLQPPSFNEIINTVCDHYGITPEQMMMKTRKSEIRFPRQVAIYFCRTLRASRQEKLEYIGRKFKKDHATVLHSMKVINNELYTNKSFKIEMKQLRSIIKGEAIKPGFKN